MADAFKRFATLKVEERESMGKNSCNYALKHLTKEVNLGIIVNEINKILK